MLGQADFTGGDRQPRRRRAHGADAELVLWRRDRTTARLIVADTGNRRVLVWNGFRPRNGAPADLVLGQRDFVTRDENAGACRRRAAACAGRTRIAVAGGMLFVADAGNNRVMVWRDWPRSQRRACDFVLGQSDFIGARSQSRAYYPTAARAEHAVWPDASRSARSSWPTPPIRASSASSLTASRHGRARIALAGQPQFSDKGDNRWRCCRARQPVLALRRYGLRTICW